MFNISKKIRSLKIPEAELSSIMGKLKNIYPTGEDPWGLNLDKAKSNLKMLWPLYKHYFKVKLYGTENVPNRPLIIVSNHSGQIAIDGMLVSIAFATEVEPPRILRSMVERFVMGIPFFGSFAAEGGAVLGDRQNCLNILKKEQSVLVFPEGVRGVAKSTNDFYKLQSFTRGFFRIALEAGVDILPVAVVGAEETYPLVYQAKDTAKKLGLPALPLTPLFPWFGALGAIPLPSPIDIHIGNVYEIPKNLSADAPDMEINKHVNEIQAIVQKMVDDGLKNRRDFWANELLANLKEKYESK